MPRFEPIFVKLKEKGDLPALTRGLMGFSNFLIGNWWWLIPLAAGAVVGFITWKRSPRGRYLMDSWKLRVPTAGTIFLNLSLSRGNPQAKRRQFR